MGRMKRSMTASVVAVVEMSSPGEAIGVSIAAQNRIGIDDDCGGFLEKLAAIVRVVSVNRVRHALEFVRFAPTTATDFVLARIVQRYHVLLARPRKHCPFARDHIGHPSAGAVIWPRVSSIWRVTLAVLGFMPTRELTSTAAERSPRRSI